MFAIATTLINPVRFIGSSAIIRAHGNDGIHQTVQSPPFRNKRCDDLVNISLCFVSAHRLLYLSGLALFTLPSTSVPT